MFSETAVDLKLIFFFTFFSLYNPRPYCFDLIALRQTFLWNCIYNIVNIIFRAHHCASFSALKRLRDTHTKLSNDRFRSIVSSAFRVIRFPKNVQGHTRHKNIYDKIINSLNAIHILQAWNDVCCPFGFQRFYLLNRYFMFRYCPSTLIYNGTLWTTIKQIRKT